MAAGGDGPTFGGSRHLGNDLLKGEKRQLTALFYDLVGSTALLQVMDPEDFFEIQNAVHNAARDAILSEDGHVDLLVGDGGCAYFGYPVADEDAARKAVSAGLAIVDRISQVNGDIAQPIAVRVGIATASALIGYPGSPNAANRVEIVGLAPTLAARIQGAAAPGTVAISNATYLIVRRLFEFEPLGDFAFKGMPDRQAVWCPLREKEKAERFEATRTPDSQLVARKTEIAILNKRWQAARTGAGQAVYIHGEPGIGKSRVVKTVKDNTKKDNPHLIILQCDPACQSMPFLPILRNLRSRILANDPGFDFKQASLAGTEKALDLPGLQLSDRYRHLLRLLDPDHTIQIGEDIDDEEYNEAVVGALLDIVGAISAVKPVLLIVEDFHWTDSQTDKVMRRLIARLAAMKCLIVVTSRDPTPEQWTGSDAVTELQLNLLDGEEIGALVRNIIGEESYSRKLGEAIAAKSGGNPLYAEELTWFLLDRKSEQPLKDVEWVGLFSSEKTASLQELLSARLADLGLAKIVVLTASAIGRRFSATILSLVLTANGAAADAERHLDHLVKSGFLMVQVKKHEPIYSFRHLLVQESAYQGLLKSSRKKLHETIYHLANENPDFNAELSEAEIGDHAEKAELYAAAAGHFLRAGRYAFQQSALSEASTLLHHALSIAQKQTGAEAQLLELEIIKWLGPALITLEGSGSLEVRKLYETGIARCQALTDVELSRWFPVYWGWWFTAQNFRTQRKRAEIILTDMASSAEPEIQLQAQHCQWATSFNLGEHKDCLNAVDRALSLYNPDKALRDRIRFGGHDAKVCGFGESGLSLWFIGKTESALANVQKAAEWAEEIDHVGSRCHALDIEVMLHRYRHDSIAVSRIASSMRSIAERHDLAPFEAKSQIFQGWATGFSGEPERGRAKLKRGMAIQEEIGTEEDFPVYMEMLAELEGFLGNNRDGVAVTVQAIERAEDAGHAFWLAELYRRQARLLSAQSVPPGEVATALNKAVEIARKQGATVLELRALVDKARFLPDQVNKFLIEDARRLLDQIEHGDERQRLGSHIATLMT